MRIIYYCSSNYVESQQVSKSLDSLYQLLSEGETWDQKLG